MSHNYLKGVFILSGHKSAHLISKRIFNINGMAACGLKTAPVLSEMVGRALEAISGTLK